MIDIPTKAEVYCSDGAAGRSTYVIFNPDNHRMTHLVVQSNRPPFDERLVPVGQVDATTNDMIRLKCTRKDLSAMEPFECEQYIRTKLPEYLPSQSAYPISGLMITTEVDTYVPVKISNIPAGEMAVKRGARVEATDGSVGQVDELLINSNNMQVTHLVLLERHLMEHRRSQSCLAIDRVYEDSVPEAGPASVARCRLRPYNAGRG
jgi:hypothetical protein